MMRQKSKIRREKWRLGLIKRRYRLNWPRRKRISNTRRKLTS